MKKKKKTKRKDCVITKEMDNYFEFVKIYIEGMGIVFHSGGVLPTRKNGYDFLENEFWNPNDVERHVRNCDITAMCTGSPGQYNLYFYNGIPSESDIKKYVAAVQLGVIVDTGELFIRDLYELEEWDTECYDTIKIKLDNGYYILSAFVDKIDDDMFYEMGQDIYIYLSKCNSLPIIETDGVPMLAY